MGGWNLAWISSETILRQVGREYTSGLGWLITWGRSIWLFSTRHASLSISAVEQTQVLGTDVGSLLTYRLCIEFLIKSVLLFWNLVSHCGTDTIDRFLDLAVTDLWGSLWVGFNVGKPSITLLRASYSCLDICRVSSAVHRGTLDSISSGLNFISHHATLGSIAILTSVEDSLHSELAWNRLQEALRASIELVARLLSLNNRWFEHRSQLFSACFSLTNPIWPLSAVLGLRLLLDHALEQKRISCIVITDRQMFTY